MRHVIAFLLLLPASALSLAQGPHALTLADVDALVVSQGRAVQLARHAEEGAEADRVAAAVSPPPQLSFNALSIDPHNLGPKGAWNRYADSTLRVDKTIELGGKPELRVAGAEAGLKAARADVADAERAQRLAAASAYWDLKLAQRQLEISEEAARLADEYARVARRRELAGDLPRMEADKLQVEARKARNEVSVARLTLERSKGGLATLLGMEDDAAGLTAVDPWPPLRDPDLSAVSVEDRADVRAAMARVEQARQLFSLAKAQRTADVTVGVEFEHHPPDGNRLWGVGISMPIGVAARQEGPIRKAAVALADAELMLAQVRAQAGLERANAVAAVKDASERVQRHEGDLIPQARSVLASTEFARSRGALGMQDLLDARRTLHAAELDAEQAHAEFAKALAALAAARRTAVADDPSTLSR